MLRNRIVGAFVAVWCAVCLSYVGARSALGALVGNVGAEVAGEAADSADAASDVGTATGAETGATTGTTGAADADDGGVAEGSGSQDAADTDANDDEWDDGFAEDDGWYGVPTDSEPETQGSNDTRDTWSSVDETYYEDYGEDLSVGGQSFGNEQTSQDAQASQNTPSLYEYLSNYTCGSCRRNCSLANPRCHNGSRIAQAKAQEYYELYGS